MRISEIQNVALEDLQTFQNPDGGWPYRGASSWTEPTALALLAHCAGRDAGTATRRALEWLRRTQRVDGGWPPRPSVDQSTWVTALAALLPPSRIGAAQHARAVAWLMRQTSADTTPLFRIRELVREGRLPEERASGWCWFPGTAAWVTPTCLATLALRKCYWRQPSAVLRKRIDAAREFLMARRCADGGWNHGSARALGFNSDSYAETTGQALLALEGSEPAGLQESFRLARKMLTECRSAAGAAWLRLGLAAHQQLADMAPDKTGACHTLADAALVYLADAAQQGYNAFLE